MNQSISKMHILIFKTLDVCFITSPLSSANSIYRSIVVDKVSTNNLSDHFTSISKALEYASPFTRIKITTGIYEENLKIEKPNIILEPKEKGGEVTIVLVKNSCVLVELKDNTESWTLKSMNLKYKSNSKKRDNVSESDHPTIDSKLENNDEANQEFMNSFVTSDIMPCIVNIKKGKLKLLNWIIDFDGDLEKEERFPWVLGQKTASLDIEQTTISGGGRHKVHTTGIYMHNPSDVSIKKCTIQHHLDGGILLNLDAKSIVQIKGNTIGAWNISAIYVEGPDSCPDLTENTINFCQAPAIKIGSEVSANVVSNEIKSNSIGIILSNCSSKVISNKVVKSHKDGIQIFCSGEENDCNSSYINKNNIIASKLNGIFVSGDQCHPKIESNYVENNKKWGIIVTDNSRADIINKNEIRK